MAKKPDKKPLNETDAVLRLGLHGAPDGPAHTTPLVKGAKARQAYGPGTYGNEQFTGRAAGTTTPAPAPEGQDKPVPHRNIAGKPDMRKRDDRYGRNGDSGVG
ncbi:hypothetical protein [Ferrovibrio xuzhouensis]|uniref:Uncharacterized protein n=1 Tax=Ferrovibrio xuzhouensis TaxID=1576914 RepID=A0ABV7VIV4_9PROT